MRQLRATAGVMAGLMFTGLAGCRGERTVQGESPYGGRPAPMQQREAPQHGMSTRNKMLLLAGTAAVYYLYQKHKNRQGEGAEGRYYRSKNGRVYFRRPDGSFQWVDPPTQPIRVPADEYEHYTGQSTESYQPGRVIRQAPAGW